MSTKRTGEEPEGEYTDTDPQNPPTTDETAGEYTDSELPEDN